MSSFVIVARDLEVRRDGRVILALQSFTVRPGERWVVLGANGSGKTTLLTVASGRLIPSDGHVELLGETVGRTDLRALRAKIGLVSSSLTRQLRLDLTAVEVVLGGFDGSLEPWWRTSSADEHRRAQAALEDAGAGHLAERRLGALSDGERQLVLLARALLVQPALLLADEPAAGLDLGARERLLARFDALAVGNPDRALLLVTHHVEEIPRSMTHALVLREGRPLACGPLGEALTSAVASECFGIPLALSVTGGRFAARALS